MDQSNNAAPAMASVLHENMAALTERQRIEQEQAPLAARIAQVITRFTGSMTFVVVHLVLYSSWIAINLGWVPGVKPFDESFVMLAMEASVEAIFLSTFVLIAQNRMAAAADRRADLDLHINLLSEHELTRLATLVERIAEKIGVPVVDPAFHEIKHNVAPVAVLDALDQRKEAEGLA